MREKKEGFLEKVRECYSISTKDEILSSVYCENRNFTMAKSRILHSIRKLTDGGKSYNIRMYDFFIHKGLEVLQKSMILPQRR
jgi:hypothetical protein